MSGTVSAQDIVDSGDSERGVDAAGERCLHDVRDCQTELMLFA